MSTLLGIVGRNPASILVCARSANVTRAVLLVSDETSEIASVLMTQLKCPVEIISCPSNPSIEEVKTSILAHGDRFGSDPIVLDITGGQKPMLLGIWDSLQRMSLRAQNILYLNDMGRLMDPTKGGVFSGSQAHLQPEEFLEWRAASCQKCTWKGLLESIPEEYKRNARIAGELLRNKTWTDRKQSLSIIRKSDSQLTGLWYEHNQWLEEFALVEASTAMRKTPGIEARLNIHVLAKASEPGKHVRAKASVSGLDENDLVLVNGARVVVVEAKARLTAKGAGSELHKRIEKARYLFGDHARVIFIHPAWGNPPPALKSLVDKRVILIGNNNWLQYTKFLQDYLG